MTEDSFTSHDNTTKCKVSEKTIIDDCHITIEFGYGSDKDMTTYTFSPVSDAVGKLILHTLKMVGKGVKKDFDIEAFGRDTISEEFDANWWEKLSTEERAKYRKDWGIDGDK